jgi:hypothetical protein
MPQGAAAVPQVLAAGMTRAASVRAACAAGDTLLRADGARPSGAA